MKKSQKNFRTAGILWLVFILFTLLVKFVDVQSIGPDGSRVGFALLNQGIADALPYNATWYMVTNVLGYVALLIAAVFGIIGALQLLRRRSLKKVDFQLYVLGAFYVLVLICYVFFELVIINYRPVLLEEELEASYPSSHTMLSICVLATAIINFRFYVKDTSLLFAAQAISAVMMVVIVIGRVLSGVHWFTDIIGALLISAALFMTYVVAFNIVRRLLKKGKKGK